MSYDRKQSRSNSPKDKAYNVENYTDTIRSNEWKYKTPYVIKSILVSPEITWKQSAHNNTGSYCCMAKKEQERCRESS
jgi:hypothetical protein